MIAALLLGISLAQAQVAPEWNLSPSTVEGDGTLQLLSPSIAGTGAASMGLSLEDLWLRDSDTAVRRVVSPQLSAAFGLAPWLRAEVSLPWVRALQPGEGESAFGGLRVGASVPVVSASKGRVGVLLEPYGRFPLQDSPVYADWGTRGGAVVAVGAQGPQRGWRINAGADGGSSGLSARLAVGTDTRLAPRIRVGAEIGGSYLAWSQPSLDAHVYTDLGSGQGLGGVIAFGAASTLDGQAVEPRVVVGLTWRGGRPGDLDGDGVLSDRCPHAAEDVDGFEDEDGCPDPDNDGDGLPDANDRCPNEAGPAEGLGCPVSVAEQSVQTATAAPLPPPRQRLARLEAGRIVIDERAHFDFDSSQLRPDAEAVLQDVAAVLVAHPEIALVEIRGHTDAIGSEAYNDQLGLLRAASARRYLVEVAGISRARLSIASFGERIPEETNATEEGRAANRRVEFVIVGGGD